jgi:hypothetical protein
MHVHGNDLCNAEIPEGFGCLVNGIFGGIFPGIGTGANQFNDFVYAIGHDAECFGSLQVTTKIRRSQGEMIKGVYTINYPEASRKFCAW